MEIKDYYDSYWLPAGYGYSHSGPDSGLLPFLQSNVTKTSRCLDLGCGNGRANGLWLKEHASSYEGADISENAVSEARALGLDARVIEDVASLPWPDSSFDVAICTEVF